MPNNTTIDCYSLSKTRHIRLNHQKTTILNTIYSVITVCVAFVINPALAQNPAPTALSETFSDWQVNCQTLSGAENKTQRYCQMSQQQVDEKSGSMVLLFTVDAANPATNTTAINTIVPFGVNLAAGITIIVDGTELSTGSYMTCLPQGCMANLQLENGQLTHLLTGTEVQVRMEILNGKQPVTVPLRLNGFQQAKSRLDALSQV